MERYALTHVEFMESDWRSEQISLAEAELAEQKRQLEEEQRQEQMEVGNTYCHVLVPQAWIRGNKRSRDSLW